VNIFIINNTLDFLNGSVTYKNSETTIWENEKNVEMVKKGQVYATEKEKRGKTFIILLTVSFRRK
jgi:hypothetical protein